MKNSPRLIIFDFDGVLADSFDTFYPLIRDAMKHIGLPLTSDQYQNFFVDNVHQSFKNYINNESNYLSFSKFRQDNYDKYYYNKNSVKLFTGALEFLKNMSKNYIITIASSGKQDNIKNLLSSNGVETLFGLILADSAHTKEGMIKEILNKYALEPQEAAMITDTVGDIRVAKKIGLRTIAVTWGFHSAKMLESEKPDYLANSFKMLYKYLKAF